MSTPFPLEEAAQRDSAGPMWDPWKGATSPHWYSGMGFDQSTAYSGPAYRLLEGMGSGAAKGEQLFAAMAPSIMAAEPENEGLLKTQQRLRDQADMPAARAAVAARIAADARDRVHAMTPDPATTGTAVQLLHGVTEGAYLMSAGSVLGGTPGAVSVVGSVEGSARYQQLREEGVDPGTAAASGALTAVTSGAGALLPAAYGTSLLTRTLTGAASNVGFGLVNRGADHLILQAGGYPEMADQEKVFDTTQMLVDAALGATFGVIHHARSMAEEHVLEALQTPENQDAALAANLAIKDRQSAPGVATDPESANAHQSALEKAQTDLMSGKPVDVSDTNVDQGRFLSRPSRDLTPESELILQSFKESGLLDEEAKLQDLEREFLQKTTGETVPRGTLTPDSEVPSGDLSTQALNERPELTIPNEEGAPTKATDLLEQAKDETDWRGAVKTAVDCFARRGA